MKLYICLGKIHLIKYKDKDRSDETRLKFSFHALIETHDHGTKITLLMVRIPIAVLLFSPVLTNYYRLACSNENKRNY